MGLFFPTGSCARIAQGEKMEDKDVKVEKVYTWKYQGEELRVKILHKFSNGWQVEVVATVVAIGLPRQPGEQLTVLADSLS